MQTPLQTALSQEALLQRLKTFTTIIIQGKLFARPKYSQTFTEGVSLFLSHLEKLEQPSEETLLTLLQITASLFRSDNSKLLLRLLALSKQDAPPKFHVYAAVLAAKNRASLPESLPE